MRKVLEEYGIIITLIICVCFGVTVAYFASDKLGETEKTVVSTTDPNRNETEKVDENGLTVYSIKYVMGKISEKTAGDSLIVTNNNPNRYVETDSNINLSAPTVVSSTGGNINYVFDGWYKDTSYSEKVVTVKPSNKTNVVLYAKWLNKYTISFNSNGGTGTMSSINMVYGTAKNLTANSFSPKAENGYNITFAGWNTKKDGSGVSYENNQSVKNLTKTPNGIVMLYAQWKKTEKVYNINYVLNKTGATNNNPSSYKISDVKNSSIKLYDAVLKGYDFKGWSTTSDGKNTISRIPKYNGTEPKNYTLYAVWSPTTYSIKYIGDTNSGNPATYTIETNTFTLKNPTQNGYSFEGWFSDRAKTQKVTQVTKGTTGNITLYGKWVPIYTIKYNSNKGSGTMSSVQCTFNVEYTIASNQFVAPTLAGYKNISFVGWNTEADGSGTSYSAGQKVMNLTQTTGATVTLYAQWNETPITYSINLINPSTGETKVITTKYGATVKLTCSFNKNGSSPKGWSEYANSSVVRYSYGQSVSNLSATDGAKVVLYAVF